MFDTATDFHITDLESVREFDQHSQAVHDESFQQIYAICCSNPSPKLLGILPEPSQKPAGQDGIPNPNPDRTMPREEFLRFLETAAQQDVPLAILMQFQQGMPLELLCEGFPEQVE